MIETENYKFKRKLILKKRRDIQTLLFKSNSSSSNLVTVFYRISYSECLNCTNQGQIKFFFAVPKKKIKKAHNRNTIKRRMREVVRQNTFIFKELVKSKNIILHLGFVYRQTYIEHYDIIENSIKETLQHVNSQIIKKYSDD